MSLLLPVYFGPWIYGVFIWCFDMLLWFWWLFLWLQAWSNSDLMEQLVYFLSWKPCYLIIPARYVLCGIGRLGTDIMDAFWETWHCWVLISSTCKRSCGALLCSEYCLSCFNRSWVSLLKLLLNLSEEFVSDYTALLDTRCCGCRNLRPCSSFVWWLLFLINMAVQGVMLVRSYVSFEFRICDIELQKC